MCYFIWCFYYWEKLTFSKLVGNKSKLPVKKIIRNALALKSKKVYSKKLLFWHYYLQLLSSTKARLRFLLIKFAREIKDSYQSSLGNEVDFRNIMNVSPSIFAKNWNFKKLTHSFADERATTSICWQQH